jgi:type VI protein secretion system component VasK
LHFILQDSAHNIEQPWQKEIMLTYRVDIENDYSFNQNSAKEVGLQQLATFMDTHRSSMSE